ncbi:MAG: sulfotransferase [Gammaproteobacteria bacterium]|nr:sulfotransferase [Gammaproteobacteria bacterium]
MSEQQQEGIFSAEALIAAACEQTKLEDFGEPSIREALDILLATYDKNLSDPVGRKRCHDRVLGLLATRLRVEASFKQFPEAFQQDICAPIFVTGLPRSGTSALLNMLEAAPENRGILQWEIQFPDVWPGSAPGDEDPRYPHLVKALAAQDSAFSKIHHVEADTPEECIMLHSYCCSGVQMGFEIMLEPYRSWILKQDFKPLYEFQRKLMQLFQWRRPGGVQWMLKAPAHMLAIDEILEVFPGARFVWCHRDPQHVVPSINSMNEQVMSMLAGDWSDIGAKNIGPRVMEWYANSLERGLASRAKLPENIFVDCSQQELVDQPLALARRIYESFALPFSADTEAALQTHIDANPKGKHGKHEYELANYGLTKDAIADRFSFYYNDSRWPISD